jgi:hypothetical protein
MPLLVSLQGFIKLSLKVSFATVVEIPSWSRKKETEIFFLYISSWLNRHIFHPLLTVMPNVLCMFHQIFLVYSTKCSLYLPPNVLFIFHQMFFLSSTKCSFYLSPNVLFIFHQMFFLYSTKCSFYLQLHRWCNGCAQHNCFNYRELKPGSSQP